MTQPNLLRSCSSRYTECTSGSLISGCLVTKPIKEFNLTMHPGSLSSLQWSASPFPFRITLVHLPCPGHLSPFTHLGSLTSADDWGNHHWIPISLNPFNLALRPPIWRGLLLVLLLSHATFNRKNFTRSLSSFAQTLKEIAKVRRHALLCASVFEISRLIVYVVPPI